MNSTTPSAQTTRAVANPMESETVSRAVVDAVADAKDVSPVDVYPPLYEAVDPDALEQFVASVEDGPDATEVRISFTYAGFDVTVYGDGDVTVAE